MGPQEDSAPEEGAVPVQFIDFEYAAYNPRAYDIANHFCEYAGPECNYDNYPSLQEAARFVRHYLEAGSGGATVVRFLDHLYPTLFGK